VIEDSDSHPPGFIYESETSTVDNPCGDTGDTMKGMILQWNVLADHDCVWIHYLETANAVVYFLEGEEDDCPNWTCTGEETLPDFCIDGCYIYIEVPENTQLVLLTADVFWKGDFDVEVSQRQCFFPG
jgi:hypothetical protein